MDFILRSDGNMKDEEMYADLSAEQVPAPPEKEEEDKDEGVETDTEGRVFHFSLVGRKPSDLSFKQLLQNGTL